MKFSSEHAATPRLLLQYRKRLNEVKDFCHKAQDLCVFLRKLIQLREVPRPLRRPRWAYAAGLRERKVRAGGEIPGRAIELSRLSKKGGGDPAEAARLRRTIR